MSESAFRSALFTDKDGLRRKRHRRLRIVVLLVVGWLVLNGTAAWLLVHPKRVAPFLRFEDVAPAEGVGPAQRAFHAITRDGLKLAGTSVAPASPRGVVVFFHGYGGMRFSRMARIVSDWGYVGVAVDFRAHGESEGDASTIGWKERFDVEAVLDEVRGAWPGLPVAGWGLSMGGAALIYATESTQKLDAVVLEAVYSDIATAYWTRVKIVLPSWLAPLAYPAKVMAERFGGLDPEAMRPAVAIAALDGAKVMLVGGEQDKLCRPAELAALAAALPTAKVRTIAGADHHNMWTFGGDAYLADVRAFLDARLKTR